MAAVSNKIAVVICAAGSSSRMGGIKKEYLPLPSPNPALSSAAASGEKQLTVLGASVAAFASCRLAGPIVITIPPGQENEAKACCEGFEGSIFFVPGGLTRRASVHNALIFLKTYDPSHVLIHDGARPWIKPYLIEKIIDTAICYGAAIPALPLSETPKELVPREKGQSACEPAFIKQHLRRENLYIAQTPQGFKFPEILLAHEKAAEKEKAALNTGENHEYTDDAELWGEFIGQVAAIDGDAENRKITFPEDIS